jgi:thioredoxin reductase (NADPH)
MLDTRDEPHGTDFDVMIIGGGPAGLSAAIWCADLKLRAVLFDDGAELGGQLKWTFNEIRNYPGIASISAEELCRRFIEHAESGTAVMINARVERVELLAKTAVLDDGRVFTASAVIIATGVRRRRLEVPGEGELTGRGILTSGVRSQNQVAGRHVLIVGGGDAALENAVLLSRSASRITLIHRGEAFRSRREFVDEARQKDNITVRPSTHVTSILGSSRFEAVELLDVKRNERFQLNADFLLIRIGTQPNTELFMGQIETDSGGFIKVTADTSTSLDRVHAIGDAALPFAPTLSTAIGTAAIAAKLISSKTQSNAEMLTR